MIQDNKQNTIRGNNQTNAADAITNNMLDVPIAIWVPIETHLRIQKGATKSTMSNRSQTTRPQRDSYSRNRAEESSMAGSQGGIAVTPNSHNASTNPNFPPGMDGYLRLLQSQGHDVMAAKTDPTCNGLNSYNCSTCKYNRAQFY